MNETDFIRQQDFAQVSALGGKLLADEIGLLHCVAAAPQNGPPGAPCTRA